MTTTDKIIFFTTLFLFWRGWSKGFAQTVLGPVALIIGTLLSYLYYMLYHNIIIATAIGIVGPIILNIIFSMTLGTILLGDDKKNYSILSRFGGALINTFWGEFLLITGLFLILFIPLKLPPIEKAQSDIERSWTYAQVKVTLNQIFKKDFTNTFDPSKLAVLSDPKALETLGKTKEFKELLENPHIQELLNDPQMTQAIEQKDIGKLLQNPKFINLTKDPALLKKFLSLYSAILEQDKTKAPAGNAEIESSQNPKGKQRLKTSSGS